MRKRILFVVLGVCLVGTTSLASPMEGTTTEEVVYPGGSRFLTAGASVLLGEGTGSPGFTAGILARLSPHLPIYGGAELGTYFLSLKSGGMALSMLPTAIYEWDEGGGWVVYLGLMTGPVVAFSEGESAWRLATLIRPGVRMPLVAGMDANIEVRMGFIGSTYYFLPQFGAAFTL